MIQTIDLKIGKYLYPVKVCRTHKRIFFQYGYNKGITEELKSMEGAQYHGYDGAPYRELALSIFKQDKIWSVVDSCRNQFQLEYLRNGNPYAKWDKFLKAPIDLEFERNLRQHQKYHISHAMMVHYGIWAAEMGTGKSLMAIEVMERSGFDDWWWIAPKSALRSVNLQLLEWGSQVHPKLMTYEGLVKLVKEWTPGMRAPRGVFFDESQKIKTPTAQRSQASKHLADSIRADWGDDGFVILMSGSPAPKSPLDWWHQCEVAYPGFLKEGTLVKFRLRLGLHEQKESMAGGTYNEKLTWLDDEKKCKHCGKYAEDTVHISGSTDIQYHEFEKSINEVDKLYRRMKGLVVVTMKKDCLDLPEKQYRVIKCDVLPSTVRAARMIAAQAKSTAQALTLLRELSDGFQYVERHDGDDPCPLCQGSGKRKDFRIKDEYKEEYEATGLIDIGDQELTEDEYRATYFNYDEVDCEHCAGSGKVPHYVRDVERVPCPKDEVFINLLEEHEDVGRLVCYAGFSGSVDRCVEVALSQKWAVVKWDGKGVKVWDADGSPIRTLSKPLANGAFRDADGSVEPITLFQKAFAEHPRVVFIGNAEAAGTGLTLTASPSIVYYSNSFNADSRIQSEDRIHRMGMDENRGATIYDIHHLPTDKYVLDNLKEKRKLLDISLGQIVNVFDEAEPQKLINLRD